jgi:DNA-binding CsgD family transcriptional regulator
VTYRRLPLTFRWATLPRADRARVLAELLLEDPADTPRTIAARRAALVAATPLTPKGQETLKERIRGPRRPPGIAPRTPRVVMVAEVSHLLAAGASPERIAAQLGVTPGAVGRALHRAGYVDLARSFW